MKINLSRISCIILMSFACFLTSCAHVSSPARTQPATGLSTSSQAKHIALLLPLNGPLGYAGQAVRDGILAAYYQAKQQQQATPTINFYNTHANQDIVAIYNRAIEQGADTVIGPLDKTSIARLVRAGTIKVPTIALNELPPNITAPRDFIQFSLLQTAEAEQVAKQAWQDGKRTALLIIPAGKWGADIGKAFTEVWQAQGGIIADGIALQKGQNINLAIQHLLKVTYVEGEALPGKKTKPVPEPRHDADMVFIALTPDLAQQIRPLLQFYYAGNLSVYATSLALSSQATPNEAIDMQGVIICDMPWVINQPDPHNHANQKSRLYALGMDAYQLSQNFARLNTTEGLLGNTGTLQLGTNNKIMRSLVCTPLHKGTEQEVNQPISNSVSSPAITTEQPATNDNDYLEF